MRNFKRLLFSLNFLYVFLIAVQVAAIIFLCLFIPSLLPSVVAGVIIWLFSAITAAVLFARRGAPEVKCAWFVAVCALPVAGALIYFIATVKKPPVGILKVCAPQRAGLPAAAGALCGTGEAPYERAEYFKDGAQFFNAAFEAVKRAKTRVYIEFFIIGRGQIFNKFLQALACAKSNGAEIKIILDGLGSAFKIGGKQFNALKELGAEIKIFRKLTPFPRAKFNFRDHRKIIAVDGEIAFTGGVNLSDEYANINSPYGYWKDSGIAIYGGAAKIFEGMFLSVWNGLHEMEMPAGGNKLCLPYYDSPPHRTFCEDAYISAINGAKKRIHILTPYFCVSGKLGAALAFASKRGVEVKIIIPHIPDKKYAFAITKAFAEELKDCVQFYEYIPGFMHAKSLVCDDKVFLGSYNFDFRSTHYNFECGVMFDGEMAEFAENDFLECLAVSKRFDEGKISPFKRFARFILRLFSPLI